MDTRLLICWTKVPTHPLPSSSTMIILIMTPVIIRGGGRWICDRRNRFSPDSFVSLVWFRFLSVFSVFLSVFLSLLLSFLSFFFSFPSISCSRSSQCRSYKVDFSSAFTDLVGKINHIHLYVMDVLAKCSHFSLTLFLMVLLSNISSAWVLLSING